MSSHKTMYGAGTGALALLLAGTCLAIAEDRGEVSFLRGPYNIAFFNRHNAAYRTQAAIHIAHAKAHDVLALTPLERHAEEDEKFDREMVDYVQRGNVRIGPHMEPFGPYTARVAWELYRTIDWTHMHHDQTYDIMAARNVAWEKKKDYTDRSVRYYLTKQNPRMSSAPLDVTMRRAAVMMKPYFTLFRNYYPKASTFFFYAHWWHPAIYEAQMLAGNDREQEALVRAVNGMTDRVIADRPLRMLLSREMMPRYSRMSPESGNIFDNLHMLHGIAYDILSYDKWTPEQQRAELYRVIRAMSYQPGDEQLARKFPLPHPDVDPRIYADWMKGMEGEMNRIMREMMEEMMPMMRPEGMSEEQKTEMREKMMAQFHMKMRPYMQEGELPGSLHDALMKVMPNMKMMQGTMEAGATPQRMVETMLRGWREKYGNMPDVEPYPMPSEPAAPPMPGGS